MASVPISVLAFVRPVSFNAGWTEVHRGTIPVCLLLGAASVARKSDRAKVDVVALIVVLTVLVCLLTILVAGLLRSHADILRCIRSAQAWGIRPPATRLSRRRSR
jgi:NhaP-type Na+/H+ or K+/H+ antiporter